MVTSAGNVAARIVLPDEFVDAAAEARVGEVRDHGDGGRGGASAPRVGITPCRAP
jgi:hypothetical protein